MIALGAVQFSFIVIIRYMNFKRRTDDLLPNVTVLNGRALVGGNRSCLLQKGLGWVGEG